MALCEAIIGVDKAAFLMLRAIEDNLRDFLVGGMVVTKYGNPVRGTEIENL